MSAPGTSATSSPAAAAAAGTAEHGAVVLRLALLGCGVISRHHIDAIARMASPRPIAITAVIEPDPTRRAAAAAAVAEALGGAPPKTFESLDEARCQALLAI